jgi:hypothetical protein
MQRPLEAVLHKDHGRDGPASQDMNHIPCVGGEWPEKPTGDLLTPLVRRDMAVMGNKEETEKRKI